jgi:glycosyltransferase involved in cell wall biosynthesis
MSAKRKGAGKRRKGERRRSALSTTLPGSVLRVPASTDEFYGMLVEAVEIIAREHGLDIAEVYVEENLDGPPEYQAQLWHSLSSIAAPTDPGRAVAYAVRAFELTPTPSVAKRIAQLMRSEGEITQPERLARYCLELEQSRGQSPTAEDVQNLANLEGFKHLYLHGFPLPPRASQPPFAPIPNKSIYLLHNSLPYASGGYATRTHGLLQGIHSAGISVVACTRHGFPWDLPQHRATAHRADIPDKDIIDGILYRRLRSVNTGRHQIPLDQYLRVYAERVVDLALSESPAILHAASFFMNGLAAATAGHQLRLPTVYEIRGLTEITKVSRAPWWQDSEEHRMYERLETAAATAADHVITITKSLKEEFVRRGVDADRISIVPNSVDADLFRPAPRDPELDRSLSLQDKVVIGYIGSFVDYEGLDDLLMAARLLLDRGNDFALLLVGDGADFDHIQMMVNELDLQRHTIVTGRVPFADVHRYYSLIDIAPFPRKPLPVTEIVSPLKPFEAMAMEKSVVVSSVHALTEMVIDGETGLIFEKGKCESLVATLERLLVDGDLRKRLGKSARAWVAANRSWERAGKLVANIYQDLQSNVRQDETNASRPYFFTPNTSLLFDLELRALERRLSRVEAGIGTISRNQQIQ